MDYVFPSPIVITVGGEPESISVLIDETNGSIKPVYTLTPPVTKPNPTEGYSSGVNLCPYGVYCGLTYCPNTFGFPIQAIMVEWRDRCGQQKQDEVLTPITYCRKPS